MPTPTLADIYTAAARHGITPVTEQEAIKLLGRKPRVKLGRKFAGFTLPPEVIDLLDGLQTSKSAYVEKALRAQFKRDGFQA